MCKKQQKHQKNKCLLSCDYLMNYNENENINEKYEMLTFRSGILIKAITKLITQIKKKVHQR